MYVYIYIARYVRGMPARLEGQKDICRSVAVPKTQQSCVPRYQCVFVSLESMCGHCGPMVARLCGANTDEQGRWSVFQYIPHASVCQRRGPIHACPTQCIHMQVSTGNLTTTTLWVCTSNLSATVCWVPHRRTLSAI